MRLDTLQEQGVTKVDLSGGYEVTSRWLGENLYRVSTYTELTNGNYVVYLLSIEPSNEETFEELCETFRTTPYSRINSYNLVDGVNCQGMTCYIVDWCQKHQCTYKIGYTPSHTYITVCVDGRWYLMSFTAFNSTIAEVDEDGNILEEG